jgi:hypothetical protein
MKRLFDIFSLTRSEQRVVVILILALLAATLLTKARETNKVPTHSPSVPAITPAQQEPD